MRTARPLILSAGSLLLILTVITGLELTNTTHFFHKTNQPTQLAGMKSEAVSKATTAVTTPAAPKAVDKTQPVAPPVNTVDNEKRSTATSSTLLTPTGTFVSAHKGVPATATLSSVCNTTSGAQCQIIFTMGDISKSLEIQTADRVGAVYWNSWSPASIGLTPGQWQVKAIATYNGRSESNVDSLALEITS